MARIDLAGKPICITGGSSGIGRATAIACAAEGMPVVLTARREDRLGVVVKEIEATGGRALAFPGDVTDRAAMTAMVDRCVSTYGSVYSVYANAGYGIDDPVHKVDERAMRDMFEVNYWGTMNVIWAALPHMMAAKSGHIVICSSTIAKISLPGCGAYCATKAAQNMIGRAMNLELADQGIRTSTVHPVGTRTEFFDIAKGHSSDAQTTLDKHAPKWAMQSSRTVANAIVSCLHRPRPEVWPSWAVFVRVALGITTAFPFFADMGTRRLAHPDK